MSDQFAALTDRGQRRESNQDEALASTLPGGAVLLAVADGVGGLGGGDLASAETVRVVHATCLAARGTDPATLLREAIAAANRRVRELASEEPARRGMASTLVAAIVRGDTAWIASIGDSRAYLCRDGRLEQLTEDDSWVAEQVRVNLLSEDEARQSPQRNVITRGIGVEETAEVEPIIAHLDPGSTLLLCSDGLHGVVDEAAVATILASGSAEGLARALIACANAAGGPDNIAVALYRTPFAGTDTGELTAAG